MGTRGTSEEGEWEQREHVKRASGNNGKQRRGKVGTSEVGEGEQRKQEKRVSGKNKTSEEGEWEQVKRPRGN